MQLRSEAFDELLASKYGLDAFRVFLKSELYEENTEFWLAYEDFKKTKSPQKQSSKAKKIYTEFIEKEAPKEINIDFQTKTDCPKPVAASQLPGKACTLSHKTPRPRQPVFERSVAVCMRRSGSVRQGCQELS